MFNTASSYADDSNPPTYSRVLGELRHQELQNIIMRKSIGFVIILWALSQFFTSAFTALDGAARESFNTIQVAAVVSQQQLQLQAEE